MSQKYNEVNKVATFTKIKCNYVLDSDYYSYILPRIKRSIS